jgi:hypothetical protein
MRRCQLNERTENHESWLIRWWCFRFHVSCDFALQLQHEFLDKYMQDVLCNYPKIQNGAVLISSDIKLLSIQFNPEFVQPFTTYFRLFSISLGNSRIFHTFYSVIFICRNTSAITPCCRGKGYTHIQISEIPSKRVSHKIYCVWNNLNWLVA